MVALNRKLDDGFETPRDVPMSQNAPRFTVQNTQLSEANRIKHLLPMVEAPQAEHVSAETKRSPVPQTRAEYGPFVPSAVGHPSVTRELSARSSDGFGHAPTPQELTKNTVLASVGVGGAAGVATGAAITSLGYFEGGALAESAVLGSAVALPVAVNGLVSGASIYLGGVLHNYLWRKKGEAHPGFLGTFGRGLIAPISVPLGVVRNLTWNRNG